jgi:multicomponent Na+:H+ antiporter subunit F
MDLNEYLQFIILPLLSVSVLLAFFRFMRGPKLADRIVALDLIITIGIAIMAVYAIISEKDSFLDIAMIFALIAFLGTTAFSYYIENKYKDE